MHAVTMHTIGTLASALVLAAVAPHGHASASLAGWAKLDAATFSAGPTSGQFISSTNGVPVPFHNRQPVQGFSAVLDGPQAGTYIVLADNGFGAKSNSADHLLRLYSVRPDWASRTVQPADARSGAALPAFTDASFIALRDPDGKLGFPIVANMTHYPNGFGNIPVDPAIKLDKLLTGFDLDIESVRRDKRGNLWIGDEFGPFLIKTDATGKVLRSEIPLPGVMAPQNPYLGGGTANLATSRGFEGLALNKEGDTLYTLLEGTVNGDPARTLRINALDLASETYTAFRANYLLEPQGAAIGEITAIDNQRFLVIERDNGQGATALFKKIFIADMGRLDSAGYVHKTELVDLMNLADPLDLNGDGNTSFSYPFVTIEAVLIVDPYTLLVVNDNNFPFSSGRAPGVADNNEFILVRLAQPIPEAETYAMMLVGLGLVGLMARRRHSCGRERPLDRRAAAITSCRAG